MISNIKMERECGDLWVLRAVFFFVTAMSCMEHMVSSSLLWSAYGKGTLRNSNMALLLQCKFTRPPPCNISCQHWEQKSHGGGLLRRQGFVPSLCHPRVSQNLTCTELWNMEEKDEKSKAKAKHIFLNLIYFLKKKNIIFLRKKDLFFF